MVSVLAGGVACGVLAGGGGSADVELDAGGVFGSVDVALVAGDVAGGDAGGGGGVSIGGVLVLLVIDVGFSEVVEAVSGFSIDDVVVALDSVEVATGFGELSGVEDAVVTGSFLGGGFAGELVAVPSLETSFVEVAVASNNAGEDAAVDAAAVVDVAASVESERAATESKVFAP